MLIIEKVMKMYKNKYYNCGPRCNCGEEDVLGEVQKGLNLINDGFKDILCGLNLICCHCKICEGIKYIERGICKIEKGLDLVVNGLTCIEFECDYRNNGNIKNGVCGIKEALRQLKKGLCQLEKCCLCDGIESIQCGLHHLEQGVCSLTKGIKDIRDQQGYRRDC
jgi:hypothetical protein